MKTAVNCKDGHDCDTGLEGLILKQKKIVQRQQPIKLDSIDDSMSWLRLIRPEQISQMQISLERQGQLHPVIVRKQGCCYQLLDGFKRYYASLALHRGSLQAHLVEADDITAKAIMINYNHQGSSLADYEEAQIVYSLKKDHLLKQEEIAMALSRSHSWVCRRLSFIERLDTTVCHHLRLGKLTPTHAREMVKLPRGKQPIFLKVIIDNNLSSRHTALLVNLYLKSKTTREQDYLLKRPMEVIERAHLEGEIYDSRLSPQGNRLLKTLRILSHQQHILIGQLCHPPLKELPLTDGELLTKEFAGVLRKSETIRNILNAYERDER